MVSGRQARSPQIIMSVSCANVLGNTTQCIFQILICEFPCELLLPSLVTVVLDVDHNVLSLEEILLEAFHWT